MGRSMSAPQAPHDMLEVADIRAIVECAPQSGHSERNSKRFMQ